MVRHSIAQTTLPMTIRLIFMSSPLRESNTAILVPADTSVKHGTARVLRLPAQLAGCQPAAGCHPAPHFGVLKSSLGGRCRARVSGLRKAGRGRVQSRLSI